MRRQESFEEREISFKRELEPGHGIQREGGGQGRET